MKLVLLGILEEERRSYLFRTYVSDSPSSWFLKSDGSMLSDSGSQWNTTELKTVVVSMDIFTMFSTRHFIMPFPRAVQVFRKSNQLIFEL